MTDGQSRIAAFALALLIALKVGIVAVLGPTIMPDSSTYIDYANAILAGRIDDPAFTGGAFPLTLFRIAGYPLLIVGAKLLSNAVAAPSLWPWLLVALQFAVSLRATVLVYRLAGRFGLRPGAALFVAGAQATTLPLVIDQAILTDSLDASLLTLAAGVLVGAVLDRRAPAPGRNLAAGSAIAASFLLREATSFTSVAFALLALAAACASGAAWRRIALSLVLTFGPLLVTNQLYKEWNYARTGARFVTTGAQRHLLDGLIKASQFDPRIFDGDTPLDGAVRRVVHDYSLDEAARVSDILFAENNESAIQIASEVYAAYFRAWREHPLAMLQAPSRYLKEWQAKLALQPIETIRLLLLWNTNDDHDFGAPRTLAQGRWSMAPAVILRVLTEAVSIAIFAAFLLLTPARALREGGRQPLMLAQVALWMLYLGYVATYALVYLEPRYLAPVLPWSILIGVANLAWLWSAAPLPARWRKPPGQTGAVGLT